MNTAPTIHASVARVRGRGVLIRGASGSGKSSLLLALLDSDAEAMLIADDRVALRLEDDHLIAKVPPALGGLMEIRGVGIVRRPHLAEGAIDLVVDLVAAGESPRLPDEDERSVAIAGVMLRRIFILAGAADGAARVRAALAAQFS